MNYSITYIYICRVSVFGPNPLQWICREWVQKLGSKKATACFGDEKYTESDDPTSQGERAPRPKTGTPNSPCIPGASLLFLGLLVSPPPLRFEWSLLLYTHFFRSSSSYTCQSSVPILECIPIGHSFWRSGSCCGPHRTVQGSHPHQWDQGVSCEYLIQRWQFLLGLLFYHAPMASP